MKISNQLMIVMALTFGVSLTANANLQSYKGMKRSTANLQKTFKVENCDCVAEQNGVPTFLSDLRGDVAVSASGKTLMEAEKKATKMCTRKFKTVKKSYAYGASISGCRKKVNVHGFNRWKEI